MKASQSRSLRVGLISAEVPFRRGVAEWTKSTACGAGFASRCCIKLHHGVCRALFQVFCGLFLSPLCGNATLKEVFLLEQNELSSPAQPASLDLGGRLRLAAAELSRTGTLTGCALCAALNVVLNQYAIPVSTMLEIGFAFLATASCAFMYGPFAAALMAGIADILGFFLRPNGTFFLGFTLNAVLSGLIYGLWLYKKPVSLVRTFCACLTVVVSINLLLTPIWLHILYGNTALLSSARLIKNVIKLPVDTLLLYTTLKSLARRKRA